MLARRAIGPAVFVLVTLLSSLLVLAPADSEARDIKDPFEVMNRGTFWFNDQLDAFILEPVAIGWDFIVPDGVQTAVGNFFENLGFPVVFVNDLLQGKLRQATHDVGRFVMNTTIGLGGLLDPASHYGLERSNEDFGQTLGRWGSGSGPYLVLPLLGPSNPRDALGLAVDTVARVWPFFVDSTITWSAAGADTINTRSLLLEEVEVAKEGSLDYYAAVRNAYTQRRESLIGDYRREKETVEEDDLYYPDLGQ
ncbi:MAG: VacJ family lipoprotein [Candidatus Binatia bacterium]